MKKLRFFTMTMLAFLLIITGTAFASFNDLSQEQGKNEIESLQLKGIINGVNAKSFSPNRSLSYAEAVTIWVKAFNLNIDNLKFIKEPKASDIYPNMKDTAWYANSFMVAFYNGVEFPKDIKPEAAISRQEFAFYLHKILTTKGNYTVIELWNEYADLDQVKQEYQGSINVLINMGIIKLGKENKFYPTRSISRAEAAVMVYHSLEFMEKMEAPVPSEPPKVEENVNFIVEKVNDAINKVTLNWGEQPSSGYSITIDKIEFNDNVATISFTLHYPEPDKIYLTVITHPMVSTYIDAQYKVEIKQSSGLSTPIEKPVKTTK